MTSSHHAPYAQGYKRATMPGTKGSETARWSKSQKAGPSSDCRLQPACMKVESVVIADQPGRGEYVLGPCTHRPSRQLSRGYLKLLTPIRLWRKGGNEGTLGEEGEVVTRQPYRKVRLDHLLSKEKKFPGYPIKF